MATDLSILAEILVIGSLVILSLGYFFSSKTHVILGKKFQLLRKQQGAESYNLFQNGELVYSGNSTSFYFEDQADGNYTYELYAILSSEASIISDSTLLQYHNWFTSNFS